MTHSTTNSTTPVPGLDADRRLIFDVICGGCGYNLKRQLAEGNCPECGRPVKDSGKGRWLQYHDPRWVRRLAMGAKGIMLGLLLGLAVIPSTFLILFGFGVEGIGVTLVLIEAGLIIGVIGCWRFTTVDPDHQIPQRLLSLRRIIRWTSVVNVVIGHLFVILAIVEMTDRSAILRTMNSAGWLDRVMEWLVSMMPTLFTVWLVAVPGYLSQLASHKASGKWVIRLRTDGSSLWRVGLAILVTALVLEIDSVLGVTTMVGLHGLLVQITYFVVAMGWVLYGLFTGLWIVVNLYRVQRELYQLVRATEDGSDTPLGQKPSVARPDVDEAA